MKITQRNKYRISLQTMTNELTHVFLLSVGAFLLTCFNANLYVFAYRYNFWKRQGRKVLMGKKAKGFCQIPSGKIAAKHSDDGWVSGVISVLW